MGNRGAGLASVDSYRLDSPLNTNRGFYLLPLGLLRHIAIWASTGITEAATSGPKKGVNISAGNCRIRTE